MASQDSLITAQFKMISNQQDALYKMVTLVSPDAAIYGSFRDEITSMLIKTAEMRENLLKAQDLYVRVEWFDILTTTYSLLIWDFRINI